MCKSLIRDWQQSGRNGAEQASGECALASTPASRNFLDETHEMQRAPGPHRFLSKCRVVPLHHRHQRACWAFWWNLKQAWRFIKPSHGDVCLLDQQMVKSGSECKILRSPKQKSFHFLFLVVGISWTLGGSKSKTAFSGFSVNAHTSSHIRKYAIHVHK